MKKRILGRTGLKVSELSLGGLFITTNANNFKESKKAVNAALHSGINYIDTAPFYFDSEITLGKILKDYQDVEPLIVSTKLGGRPAPFLPQDKKCLMQSVEMSLDYLGRDYIDILMIHEPDRPGQYDWWTDDVTFDGPVLELMDDLKKQGIIRYTGIGGTTAYEMARLIRTHKFDVVLTAFNYSLLWREAERDILPEAKKAGMGIVVGSPLQQGALAKRYDEEVRNGAPWMSKPRREQFKALYAFLDEIKMSIAEVGLRFVLSNPDISCT
jgi:aryl-alcohol dehydrogenase-like predicted oxidoreductase